MTNREVLESMFGCEAERVLNALQKKAHLPFKSVPV